MKKIFHIAVVEDHEALREMTVAALTSPGYLVQGYANAESLLKSLADTSPDIVVLDVNLPGINGFVLAQQLRQNNPAIRILMLTVRDSISDKISGYGSGADIYLPKPVDDQELLAAVCALARRVERQAEASPRPQEQSLPTTTSSESWRLSTDGWTFFDAANNTMPLTAQERSFLQCLALQAGQAVAREKLAEILGEDPYEYDYHRLDSLVSRLRRKSLEHNVSLPLRAVRGVGYLLPN